MSKKGEVMKNILLLLTGLLLFGCQNIGSENVLVLENMEISIDTLYTSSTRFYVAGKIKNNDSEKVYAPWYIEAMFYSDSTFSTTFGGSYERMNYPLEPNVEAYWEITHSPDAIIASEYPHFAIKDLRAYVNE